MEKFLDSPKTPAPRTPLSLTVKFRRSYGRETVTGNLKNISLSGAFLDSGKGPFRIGEKIQLHFEVSGRQRKILSSVVWVNQHGCGLKFLPNNNRDVQIVDDLIYFVENNRHGKKSVLDDIFKKVG